jgi:hypothetical protein
VTPRSSSERDEEGTSVSGSRCLYTASTVRYTAAGSAFRFNTAITDEEAKALGLPKPEGAIVSMPDGGERIVLENYATQPVLSNDVRREKS